MKEIRLTTEQTGVLCQSLYHLLRAGIAQGDAFVLLAGDEGEGPWRQELLALADRADGGLDLAENLRQSHCLPHYACALLEVGGQVGRLEETLEALAQYYEGRARLERRLRAALLSPAVLLLVLLAVVMVLLVWVLPVFRDVYGQLGVALTGVAGGLLALGELLRRLLPALVLLLALTVLGVGGLALSPPLRETLLDLWRRKGGDRGISGKIARARFAQALSMALSSGLTAEEGVELASRLTQSSPAFQRRCAVCRAELAGGGGLPAALRESGLLSPGDCRLLEAGLRSGSGERVMEQISARLLEDSECALEETLGRIEPTLVVVMAGLVGAILLSVMLPLMDIMTAIG